MTPRRIVLSLLLLAGATACGSSSSDGAAPADVTPAATSATSAATPGTTMAPEAGTDATTAPAGSSPAAADSPTITIADSRFDQLELRVPAGTTVVFVNTDDYNHTITSADGSPVEYDSGKFGEGETFEFTFDEPGEYPYFCEVHPTMRATIIVE